MTDFDVLELTSVALLYGILIGIVLAAFRTLKLRKERR